MVTYSLRVESATFAGARRGAFFSKGCVIMKISDYVAGLIADAIKATTILGSAADHPKVVKLFKNNIVPTSSGGIAQFVEADFAGYGEQALAESVGVAGTDPLSGQRQVRALQDAEHQFFQVGAIEENQTVYGYYVTDDVHTNLIGFGVFDAPITLTAEGQIVDVPDIDVRFSGSDFE